MATITLQQGDTLSQLAQQHNTTVAELVNLNKENKGALPDPNNPDLILAGATLNIPGQTETTDSGSVDRALASLENQLEPTRRRDVERDVLRQFREEFDIIDDIFADISARVSREGEAALGSRRARSARAGLLGSERGEALKQQEIDATQRRLQGVEAQRLQAQLPLLQEARRQTSSALEQRQQSAQEQAILSAIQQGITDPLDIFNQFGGQVGFDEITGITSQLQQDSPDPFSLGQGQARFVFNPETGEFEQVAFNPKTFAPRSSSSSSSRSI